MLRIVGMLRNVGRLDSLTRSIDGAPSDADLALEFNNPYLKSQAGKNTSKTKEICIRASENL